MATVSLPFSERDIVRYLRAAKRALADAELFDALGGDFRACDAEMQRLREQLSSYLSES